MAFIQNFFRHPLFLLFCCCFPLGLAAQAEQLFRTTSEKASPVLARELDDYGLLEVDAEAYAQLRAEGPRRLTLALPAVADLVGGMTLELERRELFRPDFRLVAASSDTPVRRPDLGAHYVGHLSGEPDSRVSLSLLDGELTATISRANGERWALGRTPTPDTKRPISTYLLFPADQLAEKQEFDCGTADSNLPYPKEEMTYDFSSKNSAGCVDVYFEIDYDVFFDKGSITAAAQHLAANFNEVKTLYETVNVNLKISEIKVWDRISPYAGISSGTLLNQFQARASNFNGDLAQLVSYQASGGVAVLDGLCHPYKAARMSFSSIHSNYLAVPTYSWSTMVIAHELGHLMGSQHTHACVWNGNDTAIDGCAPVIEGLCGRPAIPVNGGTIMSYCHLRPVGINFLYGFGDQPGAVIANRVRAAQGCVQAVCSPNPPGGGGNGGGGNNDDNDNNDDDNDGGSEPTVCDNQSAIVRIVLDNFGMETTWKIKSETGVVLGAGGPYPKKQNGRVILDTVCVTDGCYVFEITDENGDGVCCNYGNGSFSVRDTLGNVIVSNDADFDTLAVADFCLPFTDGGDDDDDDSDADCEVINFVDNPVVTYGGNQDGGTVVLTDNNTGIRLASNAWKGIEIDYPMTEQTWVSFWFRSPTEGEVHGIGMDDNEVLSANYTFRIHGYQAWGMGDFDNYAGDGRWKYYQIPIGQFYVLEAKYLFFTADHDVGARVGVSEFRGVTITEGAPCNGGANLPGTGELAPLTAADGKLAVTPNPAVDALTVTLPAAVTDGGYEIVNLAGKTVLRGDIGGNSVRLSVGDLPNGAYVFRYRNGTEKGSERFIVAH